MFHETIEALKQELNCKQEVAYCHLSKTGGAKHNQSFVKSQEIPICFA